MTVESVSVKWALCNGLHKTNVPGKCSLLAEGLETLVKTWFEQVEILQLLITGLHGNDVIIYTNWKRQRHAKNTEHIHATILTAESSAG